MEDIIKKIKEFKRFPKNEDTVTFKDRATIIFKRTKHRKRYLYTATITFTYINRVTYNLTTTGRSLKDIREKGLIKFKARNKQMKGYEKNGNV
jgi:hypothetical protein